MGALFASLGAKIFGSLLIVSLVAGAYFLWESRIRRAAVIELQRDQLAAAVKAKDEAIADRNRVTAQFMALPDARLRLCVVQGPASGCCKPEPAACRP
jgi:hypothetical protein